MAENGRLSQSELRPIAGGGFLIPAAAAAWNAMAAHVYRETGVRIAPNGSDSSYRPLDRQVYWRNWWCNQGNCANAAVPGESNHGWAVAVDSDDAELINEYGAPFGWQKAWSDAPNEWWHFKYLAGKYTGPDPGPDYSSEPPKPSWWKQVGNRIDAARKRRLSKKQRRKRTDSAERRGVLHRQIRKLGELIARLTKRRKGA